MPKPLREKVVVFLVGPTAVGKTELSVRLARTIDAQIISCDSMQVYRRMPVMNQAPTGRQMKAVKHHLVGILSPVKEYSVSQFIAKTDRTIEAILKRGKVPLIVGGSGLYVKALVDGLFPSPGKDERFRSRMKRYAAAYGNARLYQKLRKRDPEAAEKIHPNDVRRVIRALEVYHTTGTTISELKKKTQGLSARYRIALFGLTRPRDKIYEAIDRRVERMFRDGLVEEVGKLLKGRLSMTAKAALGMKEVAGYLAGRYGRDEAVRLLKRNTRHFAKDQLTWFRADARIRWFDVSKQDAGKIVKTIVKICKQSHKSPVKTHGKSHKTQVTCHKTQVNRNL